MKSLPFKSDDVKSQYANELELAASSFGTNKTQHLREGQLVGRMLLQRLATSATGVKQARYRRGPTREQRSTRTRMRSIYIHSVCRAPCLQCLPPVPAYESAEGFAIH